MQKYNESECVWEQKYRPLKINDCILPESIKTLFTEMVSNEHIPNMILTGGPGVGKTTVAKALCEEIDASYIVINASKENGIDTVRNDMMKFASTASMTGGRKVIILDEADYLSPNAQPALRGLIQDASKTCSFIMTCNYPNRIIEPLQSRCKKISFNISKEDKPKCMSAFFKRLEFILQKENIKYDKNVLLKLISKLYPDNRKIINELQTYGMGGFIDEGILGYVDSADYNDLINFMKNKKFNEIKQWVANQSDNDLSEFYFDIYNKLKSNVTPSSEPQMILVIAEWQKYHSQVASHELNILAMLTELLGSIEFK